MVEITGEYKGFSYVGDLSLVDILLPLDNPDLVLLKRIVVSCKGCQIYAFPAFDDGVYMWRAIFLPSIDFPQIKETARLIIDQLSDYLHAIAFGRVI